MLYWTWQIKKFSVSQNLKISFRIYQQTSLLHEKIRKLYKLVWIKTQKLYFQNISIAFFFGLFVALNFLWKFLLVSRKLGTGIEIFNVKSISSFHRFNQPVWHNKIAKLEQRTPTAVRRSTEWRSDGVNFLTAFSNLLQRSLLAKFELAIKFVPLKFLGLPSRMQQMVSLSLSIFFSISF